MTALDVTLWVESLSPTPGGIGRYTSELVKGLQRSPDVSPTFWIRNRFVHDPAALERGEVLPPAGRRFGRVQGYWERWNLRNRLFHGPNFFLPEFVRNGIITIHDLSVMLHPETHPVERVRDHERHFARSVAAARHIITDSETVRQELISLVGLSEDRVSAVYLGVAPRFRPRHASEVQKILEPLGLAAGCYGLCVAALEPRKKLSELLLSWRNLPQRLRERYPLALAGTPGWRDEHIKELVNLGTKEGWLKALGFVSEDDLPALYAGAALFIYPSIYEGFGLPPLEAMASGIPVIVSDRSCLPEVCGDAPRFIDPDDIDGFTAAIVASLEDESWRAQAIRKGLSRAAQFTWERCVEQTIAVYRRAAEVS